MLRLPSFQDRLKIHPDTNIITNWKEYLNKSRDEFHQIYHQVSAKKNVQVNDFNLLRTVGTGWYGRVILVEHKRDKTFHALKVFKKESIVRLNQINHVFSERKIFQSCDFPFITKLEYYFTDNSNVYFVMPFVVGGELYSLLKKNGKLTELSAKFYSAQIILTLEYLHNVGVVYRDIKPENILIDKTGYIKLTDFGFAKKLDSERTYTMCGTPEYFAPEMITNVGYGNSVDWWSLGVLIYEMCCGKGPFYSGRTVENDAIFRDIIGGNYTLPSFFSDDLKDVIIGLLKVEIWKRIYGQKLRQMKWYKQINWLALINRRMPAPFIPSSLSDHDPSNYDEYEEIQIETSNKDHHSDIFRDF